MASSSSSYSHDERYVIMIITRLLVACQIVITCSFQLGEMRMVEGAGTADDFPSAGVFNLIRPSTTIFVDPSKRTGNFTTIQAAIDSVPLNNNKWICIYLNKGTYREKVKIPKEKPFIILKGKSRRTTEIVWGDHDNLAQSPTFTSLADNIVIKSITFRNSYNSPSSVNYNKNARVPAAAARISGDKTFFYRCGFYGLQDTLWDDQGRHYFKRCSIQGAVDFIFGGAQSLYEECSISVVAGALGAGIKGIITAQGRTNPNDSNGFVFKDCKVTGTGKAVLGRPWRAYARVLFYRSNLTDVVDSKGWDSGSFAGQEKGVRFGEYNCYGDGAATSQRVSWVRKLNWAAVKQFATMAYIDSEGWLNTQPF